MMIIRWMLACLLLFITTGCQSPEPTGLAETTVETAPAFNDTGTISASPTPSPTNWVEPTVTISASVQTTIQPTVQICSPLHGFQISQLEDILTTGFEPPTPGGEGGHHGVDFAFYSYGVFDTMEGLPVQSILKGVVAAAVADRPPYGNMMIIETPLTALPPHWQEVLRSLPQPEKYQPDPRLACPTPAASLPETEQQSLYLLYAHMAGAPELNAGSPVGCGQQIGLVGSSGFSGNIHLHLEMRLGPAGVQFLHLAHYINNATDEEMANYCAWRISPQFRLIDPMELLLAEP